MQLELSPDQKIMLDVFARFFTIESSIERVRAAISSRGFDPALWAKLAEQGVLSIRAPDESGGLGLGIFDAVMMMEEAGRTLASGPLAEAIVACRLLAMVDPEDASGLRDSLAAGDKVITLAMHDAAERPSQLVAGGAVAHLIIALRGDSVMLYRQLPSSECEPSFASTPIGRIFLDGECTKLGQGPQAVKAFKAAVEEWKLLTASALIGLGKEAVRIGAAYARERTQFNRPIGSYQALSHPLADIAVEIDAGRLMIWRAIRSIIDGKREAAEEISSAIWWASRAADRATSHALHIHGGYGLTLEYDIHLYNLRAKAWPLIGGDPELWLEEAAQRRYGVETPALPDAGDMAVEFDLGVEAAALADETRQFFERVLTPELRAKAHYSFDGHDAGVNHALGQTGLLFPAWPRRLGGREAGPYSVYAVKKAWDEFGWSTHAQATTNIVGYVMDRFGSEQLKVELLRRVISGEAVCSLGYTEPASGSDVFAAKTRAVRQGDDWVIDGAKMFTSGAEHSDYVLLLARTDPDAPKHRGITMFIVPLKSEGVTIQPVRTFQDERTNITYYDGVRIPDSYRLGEVNGGLRVMTASLEIEQGMTFVREHVLLLEAAERLSRKIDRNGAPLIENLSARTRLTRTAINITASEMLHFRTMWAIAEGRENAAFGPSSKMFSSELYRADAIDLLNLAAPEALAFSDTDAAHINWCYKHSQVATIYGGTSEIQRSMIAEKQLGLPRTR